MGGDRSCFRRTDAQCLQKKDIILRARTAAESSRTRRIPGALVELELANLDAHEAEVLPLVAHRLRRELDAAIPTVALLLSLINWQALLVLFIPEA